MKAFNESQNKIHATYGAIPSGTDKNDALRNAVTAGNAPDVASIEYATLPEMVSQGTVSDATKLLESYVDKNVPVETKQLVDFGGKLWGVPFDVAPMVFFYRSDVFKAAGVEPPKTWDEFATAAEKIKAANPSQRIAAYWENDDNLFASLAWQAGAQWFSTEDGTWTVNIDSPETHKVADYWTDLVKRDLVRKQTAYSPEWSQSVAASQTVGYISAAWGAGGFDVKWPDLSGKWAIAPLPNWGTASNAFYGGTSFVIPKGAKHPEAAAEFIKFQTSSAEAAKARVGALEAPSSALPANPEAAKVAADAFEKDAYFGGQDVFAFNESQVKDVVNPWVFGPNASSLGQTYRDNVGDGIDGAIVKMQKQTVADLKSRGLDVSSK